MKKRELFICIFTLIGIFFLLILIVIFIDSSVLLAIITALIGSAITFLGRRIYDIIHNEFSQFTGYYRDEIFSKDDPTVIIKKAKFRLTEKSGNILIGDFTKYSPLENKNLNYNLKSR